MAADEIHVDDIGTEFLITIMDGTTVVNISTATVKRFIFKKPDCSKVTKDVDFNADGTDGQLTYTTVAGDIDSAGTWRLQALVTITAGTYYSDITNFKVYPNL